MFIPLLILKIIGFEWKKCDISWATLHIRCLDLQNLPGKWRAAQCRGGQDDRRQGPGHFKKWPSLLGLSRDGLPIEMKWGIWWEYDGNMMGIWWEYDGNMMGIWWEYDDWCHGWKMLCFADFQTDPQKELGTKETWPMLRCFPHHTPQERLMKLPGLHALGCQKSIKQPGYQREMTYWHTAIQGNFVGEHLSSCWFLFLDNWIFLVNTISVGEMLEIHWQFGSCVGLCTARCSRVWSRISRLRGLGGVGGLDHYPMRSGNLELMLLMLLLTRMMHGY